jgi:hypothetical protein
MTEAITSDNIHLSPVIPATTASPKFADVCTTGTRRELLRCTWQQVAHSVISLRRKFWSLLMA